MTQGMKFLDAGCGRGDFLNHFKDLNLDTYGLDLSPEAPNYNLDLNIKVCDVEQEKLPFSNDFFDVVYSKSFFYVMKI